MIPAEADPQHPYTLEMGCHLQEKKVLLGTGLIHGGYFSLCYLP